MLLQEKSSCRLPLEECKPKVSANRVTRELMMIFLKCKVACLCTLEKYSQCYTHLKNLSLGQLNCIPSKIHYLPCFLSNLCNFLAESVFFFSCPNFKSSFLYYFVFWVFLVFLERFWNAFKENIVADQNWKWNPLKLEKFWNKTTWKSELPLPANEE